MIIEYIRASSIEEALRLIARLEPQTLPMGGGTVLNRSSKQQFAVVDLQALGLNRIEKRGDYLRVGATTTLQQWMQYPALQPSLRLAIQRETTVNLRQVASAAGTIVAAGGRSILTGTLLAMDATLEILSQAGGKQQLKLGELLAMRHQHLPGSLITALKIPLNIQIGLEVVARTTGDLPIVYSVVGRWPSGRLRLVLGGFGKAPILAMDGSGAEGIEAIARDAYSQAEDQWASAEYRQEMAGILAARCLKQLDSTMVS